MEKPNNPYRVSMKKFRQDNDLLSANEFTEFLEHECMDAIVPALCSEFCEVEPDGECSYGCPSILIVAGLI